VSNVSVLRYSDPNTAIACIDLNILVYAIKIYQILRAELRFDVPFQGIAQYSIYSLCGLFLFFLFFWCVIISTSALFYKILFIKSPLTNE
jgi:hypothetical protein